MISPTAPLLTSLPGVASGGASGVVGDVASSDFSFLSLAPMTPDVAAAAPSRQASAVDGNPLPGYDADAALAWLTPPDAAAPSGIAATRFGGGVGEAASPAAAPSSDDVAATVDPAPVKPALTAPSITIATIDAQPAVAEPPALASVPNTTAAASASVSGADVSAPVLPQSPRSVPQAAARAPHPVLLQQPRLGGAVPSVMPAAQKSAAVDARDSTDDASVPTSPVVVSGAFAPVRNDSPAPDVATPTIDAATRPPLDPADLPTPARRHLTEDQDSDLNRPAAKGTKRQPRDSDLAAPIIAAVIVPQVPEVAANPVSPAASPSGSAPATVVPNAVAAPSGNSPDQASAPASPAPAAPTLPAPVNTPSSGAVPATSPIQPVAAAPAPAIGSTTAVENRIAAAPARLADSPEPAVSTQAAVAARTTGAVATTIPLAAPQTSRAEPAVQAFAAAILAPSRARRDASASLSSLTAVASATTTAPIDSRPTETAHSPVDLRNADWPAAMIDRIEALRDAADATSTRVRIVPDSLGPVDIAVRHEAGAVHVHFSAPSETTRTLLADAAPQLADAAASRGLRLAGTSVDAGGAGEGGHRAPEQPQAPLARAPRSAAPQDTPSTDDDRIA